MAAGLHGWRALAAIADRKRIYGMNYDAHARHQFRVDDAREGPNTEPPRSRPRHHPPAAPCRFHNPTGDPLGGLVGAGACALLGATSRVPVASRHLARNLSVTIRTWQRARS